MDRPIAAKRDGQLAVSSDRYTICPIELIRLRPAADTGASRASPRGRSRLATPAATRTYADTRVPTGSPTTVHMLLPAPKATVRRMRS
uniref:Uncharacterized protein n=1 Tax=Oryza barthii TaxID=65489 RepID=A0A0D3F7W0_9ORYZ